MIYVSVLGLLTWPVEGKAGYDYDSRGVISLRQDFARFFGVDLLSMSRSCRLVC
jgi:hypothetical protein